MAVVMIEGFDHYATNSLATAKGWSANFNAAVAGRFDGQAARFSGTIVSRNKALPSNYATLFAGFAFRFSTLPAATQDIFILQAGATLTYRVGITTGGKIVVRNSSGTVIGTGTTTLVVNTWYYIETKAFINGASGTCEVHLNGVSGEIAAATTGNFGSSNLDTVTLSQLTSNQTADYDDIYILDTSGAAPRQTFLGDVRVETVFPTSDGAHTAWTPNSGSTHYTQVGETLADGDTTYVGDSTPNDIDSYGCGDIDTGATVYGVQTNLYARKDDASTRQIAPVIRQSGSDNVGTTVTLSATYLFYSQLYNQDPTPADWTPTTVNGDEFGVKEIA